MKFASAVLLLIIGTAFTVIAAGALSLSPQSAFMDSLNVTRCTLLIAGLSFMMISTRQLRRQTIELKVVKSKD